MAPNNPLTTWGNDKTMNLNTLILTNIQSSPYFKVQLFELKTFHEVVDEIYYKVEHLEPWEKGSRKTAGQTGMCGGVRGVGAGGIVSSAFCLLYKLFTLKLTKKQVNNLINHKDSPYIRGLGFMYIRYTQQPSDLWDWYQAFLNDEERLFNFPAIRIVDKTLSAINKQTTHEITARLRLMELDVKAGGGHVMTIGEMLRQWMVKLEWYSTLFPRIPVPIQKDIDVKLRSRPFVSGYQGYGTQAVTQEPEHIPDDQVSFGEAEKVAMSQRGRGGGGGYSRDGYRTGSSSHHSPPRRRSPQKSPPRSDDFSRELEREKERQRKERDKDHKRSRHDKRRSHSRERRSPDRHRSRSRDRKRSRSLSPHSKEKHRSHSKEGKERVLSLSHHDKERRKEGKKSHKSKSKHKEKERERRH